VRSLGVHRLPIVWWHKLDGPDGDPTSTGVSAPDCNGDMSATDSGPSSDDFRAKVFRDRVHTGDWRVEKLLDDGESSEVAIFIGGDARQRAIRYADREYGAFDEIELEQYQRLPSQPTSS
jgi:hypothetical protein